MAKKTIDEFLDRVTPGIQTAVKQSMDKQFADFNSIANSDDGFPSRGQLDQQFTLLRQDLRDNHKIELQFNDYLAKRIDGIKDILQQILDKMPDKVDSKESKSNSKHSHRPDEPNYLKEANKKLDTLVRAADHTKDEFANASDLLHSNDDKLDVIAKSMLSKKAFERALSKVGQDADKPQRDTYDAAAKRRVDRWINKLTKAFNKSKFGRSINKMVVGFKTWAGKLAIIGVAIKAFTNKAGEFAKKILNWFPYAYLIAGLIWATVKKVQRALQPLFQSILTKIDSIGAPLKKLYNWFFPDKKVNQEVIYQDKHDTPDRKVGAKRINKKLDELATTPEGKAMLNKFRQGNLPNEVKVEIDAQQPQSALPMLNFEHQMRQRSASPVNPSPVVADPDEPRSSLSLLNFEHQTHQQGAVVSSNDSTPMKEQPGNVVVNQYNNSTTVQNNVNTRESTVDYHYK